MMKEKQHLKSTYATRQIERLFPIDEYGVRIQLTSDNGKTNWMNLNKELFEAIQSLYLHTIEN